MRVLLVTPSPPQARARTAVPLVSWAQLQGIRERHAVTLVTTAGPDRAELEALDDLSDAGVDVRAYRRVGTDARDRASRWIQNAGRWLTSDRPMYSVWYYEPRVQQIITRLLKYEPYDVVHVNDTAAACYDFPTDVPKLLVENEVRAQRPVNRTGWLRGNWYRGLVDEADWQRWPDYQRRTWRNFDRIEMFTERDARVAAEIAPDIASRVHLNPFGVEIPPAADPAREEDGNIIFVGNFTHAPNVDAARWLALEVMPLLRARHPGARLHIYGSDPRGALRGIARDDIAVHGWVLDIEPMIERAAVVMAPVRIGGGQRMKVLQAMALGKAVVTTARGADGVMGNDPAEPSLACGGTAEEIADLTAMLLRDRPRRVALGLRARALVMRHHDIHVYGSRIDAAYSALGVQSLVARDAGA